MGNRFEAATSLQESTRLLRKQTGIKTLAFANFKLYDLRHTCLTRWAPHMDPWTLMYLAGHADMATTKRYIHPEDEATRDAMQRARKDVDRRTQEALQQARRALNKAQSGDSFGDTANHGLTSGESEGTVN